MHEKLLVKKILQEPFGFDWSLQGLGMLRLYLADDKSVRLHVWCPRLAFDGASPMHTHPWDMESLVVAGEIVNQRYVPGCSTDEGAKDTYMRQMIFCGEGGGLEGEPKLVWLEPSPVETYAEGDSYSQGSDEIHVSSPTPGTVTLVKRTFGSDVDHAFVYWPEDESWVSAEPRPAEYSEIEEACALALGTWF